MERRERFKGFRHILLLAEAFRAQEIGNQGLCAEEEGSRAAAWTSHADCSHSHLLILQAVDKGHSGPLGRRGKKSPIGFYIFLAVAFLFQVHKEAFRNPDGLGMTNTRSDGQGSQIHEHRPEKY